MFDFWEAFDLIKENYFIIIFIILRILIVYYVFYYKSSGKTLTQTTDETNEEKPSFLNGWTVVLESSELSRNQMKPLTCFGTDIVLFRGLSNKCYAFDAYCPHLGAHLGVGGTVVEESIQCPLHGWTFDQNGQCSHIPGCDYTIDVRLKKYHVLEIFGYICVWFDPEYNDPDWYPRDIFRIEEQGLLFRAKCLNELECSPKEILQHFADFEHYPLLHSDHKMWNNWPKNGLIYRLFHKIIQIEFSGQKWKAGTGSTQHTFDHFLTTDVKIFGLIKIIFKNTVHCMGTSLYTMKTEFNFFGDRQLFIGFGIIQVRNQLSQNLCRVYSQPGIINMFWAKHLADSTYKMMQGESGILSKKRYLNHPLYSKNDKSLKEYRTWLKQFEMIE